jgi:hypothetical protein
MSLDKSRFSALALSAGLLLALPASAGALEQKLIASDGAANDGFGGSVAVDGDTAVAGAPHADGGRGAVYVFSRSGDTWTQTAMLTASDAAVDDHLGQSVAIDGDAIVAAAPSADRGNSPDIGAVYTFARTGTPTRTETGELSASDGIPGAALGWSVAIDGDTIVAGAPYQEIGVTKLQGAVYTFARGGAAARTETAELTASDGAAGDSLGAAVAIDGDTIVAGAPSDSAGSNASVGSAYTFARTGTEDRTETAKLLTLLGAAGDNVGTSVAIGADTILAGAPGRDDGSGGSDQGVVYTFARTGATPRSQTGSLTASERYNGAYLGAAVAIDGDRILAGADGREAPFAAGSALVFASTGAANRNETDSLAASDGFIGDSFGASVDVDGDTLVAGSSGDDIGTATNQGSASIFFEPGPDDGDSGPGGDTGPGGDATAPVLSELRIAPARVRRRARISYQLSEPASVRFTVERAKRRHHHVSYVAMRGAFSATGAAGSNRVRFSGRLRDRALRPGRYRLVATPTDAAGNSGTPRRTRFRVVR